MNFNRVERTLLIRRLSFLLFRNLGEIVTQTHILEKSSYFRRKLFLNRV